MARRTLAVSPSMSNASARRRTTLAACCSSSVREGASRRAGLSAAAVAVAPLEGTSELAPLHDAISTSPPVNALRIVCPRFRSKIDPLGASESMSLLLKGCLAFKAVLN